MIKLINLQVRVKCIISVFGLQEKHLQAIKAPYFFCSGSKGLKLFFMLNSAEAEIYPDN